MSVAPLQRPRPPHAPPGGRLLSGRSNRARTTFSPVWSARRRAFVMWSKRLLPVAALALLASVVLYPEFDHSADKARVAFRRVSGEVEGSKMIDAKYRGLDQRGRPYMVTASAAEQVTPERINLDDPKGDVTLENGSWMQGQSKDGVYIQHANLLDLWHDVVIYRDDGVTLYTQSASMDLKSGAGGGADPVHAEGPFGTLDARDGFAIVDRGDVVQFHGKSRLVLNGQQR